MKKNCVASLLISPILVACIVLSSGAAGPDAQAADKIPIKAIVLCGFEVGQDSGDASGEFQPWVEREKLDQVTTVPGAPHVLRHNAEGLYGSVAGTADADHITSVTASEMIMALCLDPRFDLRKTYWLITGIGGIDPQFGPIGSAVWSENVVDGDAIYEIDERERPANWPYGLSAIGAKAPNELPATQPDPGGWGGAKLQFSMNYPLNAQLIRWAYHLTQNVSIPDTPALKAYRERYASKFPKSEEAPHVMIGDSLGTIRYFYGERRTQWARDWVKLWTDGKGTFATGAMETQNYVGALTRMSKLGLVDINRVMQLRAGSDYGMQPPDDKPGKNVDETVGSPTAFEAEYRAGSVVMHEILNNWKVYENTIPGSNKK